LLKTNEKQRPKQIKRSKSSSHKHKNASKSVLEEDLPCKTTMPPIPFTDSGKFSTQHSARGRAFLAFLAKFAKIQRFLAIISIIYHFLTTAFSPPKVI